MFGCIDNSNRLGRDGSSQICGIQQCHFHIAKSWDEFVLKNASH
jgi:hypothetical protein